MLVSRALHVSASLTSAYTDLTTATMYSGFWLTKLEGEPRSQLTFDQCVAGFQTCQKGVYGFPSSREYMDVSLVIQGSGGTGRAWEVGVMRNLAMICPGCQLRYMCRNSPPYDDHHRGEPARAVHKLSRPFIAGRTRSPTLATALVMCAMGPISARDRRASQEGKLSHHERNGGIESRRPVEALPVVDSFEVKCVGMNCRLR
jgi:hypothetical protein